MIVVYSFCTCFCLYLLTRFRGIPTVKLSGEFFNNWHIPKPISLQVSHIAAKLSQAAEEIHTGKVRTFTDELKSERSQDGAVPGGRSGSDSFGISPHILQPRRRRVIVAMTGATGAILGIRLLQTLQKLDVETHLVISKWADATIAYETDYTIQDVRRLATKSYSSRDVAAPISSGSFRVDAMIVVPCSMKTLSSIATGYGDDLISRAADVTFKERRRLILVARETPLSGIHLENMLKVTQNGAIIFPPVPAFYIRPNTVDDIVDQSVGRMLDLVDIDSGNFERWNGMHPTQHSK